ncbi:hypothetical protein CRT60_00270 [Azospirillum palustre]|uniref:Portal protein n=2 Tax=Azospirillum palustre TaxID=2044885 RepID=A0A2B8BPV3_9PROT|nr:hypothetical protein CRT60_00270 [Azospirillum palustre]
MDDDEFRGIVDAAIRDAVSFVDGEISSERTKALEYYNGKPFGDEEEGRSKVVITEVSDTIESMMPSLLRVFCAPERTVEFIPQGPEDVATAEQASDYCNYVFNRDNGGFSILNTWIKDGLLSKTGIVKFWWDETEKVETSDYTGLDDQTLMALMLDVDGDEATAITAHRSYQEEAPEQPPSMEGQGVAMTAASGQPQMVTLHDVTVERRTKCGRIKIVPVPPEEFLIDRNARDEENAVLVSHRREMPVGELISMGFTWDDLEGLSTGGQATDLQTNQEVVARRTETDVNRTASLDPAQRPVMVYETWMRIDRDGDGIPELRRLIVAGPGCKILRDEPTDHVPFACWCPVPMPHTFFGRSVADLTMDIQRMKSVIMRQTLDNLVLANHPRMAVVEGQVNMDDVLNAEMGAIYRMKTAGAVQPLAVPFTAAQSFPVLDYLDTVKESRTGLSRASMGLNPDSLQSTTKAAVSATISAAQGKVEMLARLFAEQGLKKLFRGMLRLICKHQDRERMIRLRNQWVPIDPRHWNAEMDCIVNVGLGNGREEEKLQALMMVKQTQEGIIQQYGPSNPMVSLPQYKATLSAILEIAGYRDSGKFFLDPPANMPQQPPAPDPKIVEAQTKAQIAMQQAQASAALEQQKAQQSVELERSRLENEMAMQRYRVDQEMMLKREQFQAELRLRQSQMIAEAQLAQQEQMLDAHTKTNMQPVQMGGEVG